MEASEPGNRSKQRRVVEFSVHEQRQAGRQHSEEFKLAPPSFRPAPDGFKTFNEEFLLCAQGNMHVAENGSNPMVPGVLSYLRGAEAIHAHSDVGVKFAKRRTDNVLMYLFLLKLQSYEPGLVKLIAHFVLPWVQHIIVGGGYHGGRNRLTSVEFFRPYYDREKRELMQLKSGTIPDLPQPRSHCVSLIFLNRLFVLGGKDTSNARLQSVLSLNDDLTWQVEPPMMVPRQFPGACVFQDKLYVVGGYNGLTQLNTVECFDGVEWTSVPALSDQTANPGVTVFQDHLYVVGGHNGGSPLREVRRFNGHSWERMPPLHNPRQGACVAEYKGLLFAVGGYDGGRLRTTEVFDGSSWRAGPEMLQPRSLFTLVVYEGLLVAIGGFSGTSDLRTVEVFDGTSWKLSQVMLSTPRISHCACVYDYGISHSLRDILNRGEMRQHQL